MKRIDCSGWTPEEIRQEVRKDFLERDQKTFVKIRRHDRLGWESTLPAGGNYSDYINNETDQKKVLKSAYVIASNVVSAMNTPFRVHIKINNNGQNCTDSESVYVATDVFDDPDLSTGQKLDTFIGLAVHESCHLKWTDFDYHPNVNDKDKQIIHNLHNLIEDERIERLCGEEAPGFANYLEATKYFMFDKYTRALRAQGMEDNIPLYAQVMNAILEKVRYPAMLTDEVIDRFGETLVNTAEILRDYPSDTEGTYRAAKELYELIVDEYAKEIQEEEKQQNQQNQSQSGADGQPQPSQGSGNGQDGQQDQQSPGTQGAPGNGQSSDSDGGNGNEGDIKEEDQGQVQTNTGKTDKNEGQKDSQGQNDGCRSLDDPSLRKEAKDRMAAEMDKNNAMNKAINDLLGKLLKDPKNSKTCIMSPYGSRDGSGYCDALDDEQICSAVLKDPDGAREIEGELEITKNRQTTFERKKNDVLVYRDSYHRIQRFIAPVAKALRLHDKDYDERVTGLRSGRLDMNKIVDIYAGSQTVYTKKAHTSTEKACVCILIDESGSMSGERIKMARDTGVLLTEALKHIGNIDLYIYGFTDAGGKIRIHTYKEKGFSNAYALGSVNAFCGTPTGEAVRAVCDRVRSYTQDKCLMFVATDGQPNSERELVSALAYAKQKNIVPVGIGIQCRAPKAGFDHGLQIDRLDQMATLLAREVKSVSIKHTKSRTI